MSEIMLTIGTACVRRLLLVDNPTYRRSIVSLLKSTSCLAGQYDLQTLTLSLQIGGNLLLTTG